MAIGPWVRSKLGPLETPVSNLYRSVFFDIEHFVRTLSARLPAETILEIGCGEGQVTEELARCYPQARIVGMDITSRVGRRFRGPRDRVTFVQDTVQGLATRNAGCFDGVIICDVLHHVPWDEHADLLAHARGLLRPEGWLVIKECEKDRNLFHLMNSFSDRVISGEPARYGTAADFQDLIHRVVGDDCPIEVLRIPPWRNNIVLIARPRPPVRSPTPLPRQPERRSLGHGRGTTA